MIDGWNNSVVTKTNGVIKGRLDKDHTFKNSKGVYIKFYYVKHPELNISYKVRYCEGCNLVSASFGSMMLDDLKRISEKYKRLGFHLPNDDELKEYRENHFHDIEWSDHWTYKHNVITGQIYRKLVLVSNFELEEI